MASFRKINVMSLLLVAGAGWAMGLFAGRVLTHVSPLTAIGALVQAAGIACAMILWLFVSLGIGWMSGVAMDKAYSATAKIFYPLYLLLLLQSNTLNDFLGLQRPVLLLTLVLVMLAKYRLFNEINMRPPKIFNAAAWIIFLAGLVLLFFWRIILVSPLHTGSIAEDLLLFFPFKNFAAYMLRSGVVPLWNPYVFSGAPFLADSQTAVFHPVTLLLALLVKDGSLSYRAGELAIVIQFIVGSIGTYLYARGIGLRSWSASIAAIVFTFGGFMVSHVRHLPIINVAVWLPWFLWSFERFAKDKRIVWQALGSVFLLIAFLGGHLQSVLYAYSLSIVYVIWRVYPDIRDSKLANINKIIFGAVSLMPFPVSLLLGAWQVLPTLELLPLSTRAVDVSYHLTTDFSMPFQNLITLMAPNFMGGISGRYWGAWSYWWEFGCYVGIFTIASVAVAAILRLNRYQNFFTAVGGLSLLLAFGASTFLHPLFYLLWPGFHLNRAPSRFLLIFTFSAAILCAYGVERLIEMRGREDSKLGFINKGLIVSALILALMIPFLYSGLMGAGSRKVFEYFSIASEAVIWAMVLIGLSIVVLYAMRAGRMKESSIKILLIAFIVFDLFSTWQGWFVENRGPESYYPGDAVLEFIKADKGLYRVDNIDVWPPNAGDAYGIQTIGGSNTLSLADYNRIAGMRQLLNVKYILARKDIDDPAFQKARIIDDVYIYRARNLTPRAFMVASASIEPDREKIFSKISSDEFSPRDIVYVEDESLKEKVASLSGTGMDYIVASKTYQPNYLELTVKNPDPGFLVLSEVYYPGWTATVDGKATHIYRADYGLRTIWLDPGKHDVTMRYDPLSFKKGLKISAVTALLLIILIAAEPIYFSKRRKLFI